MNVLSLFFLFLKLIRSEGRLAADRAAFLFGEPSVNAACIVLVSTLQRFDLASAREVLHADEAGLSLCPSLVPPLRLNSINFLHAVAATDLSSVLTQLHQLLVCHAVHIGVVRVLGIIL